jgi:hypothetical protein
MSKYSSLKITVTVYNIMTKIAKYNLDQIKEIFKINNCELLSKDYKNNKDILKYICKCGKNKKIMF